MIIEKILSRVDDHSRSMQERLFSFFPHIGLCTLLVVIIVAIIVKDDILNIIAMSVCFVVFLTITLVSSKARKIRVGTTLIALLLVLVLLPFAFIFGGSIYGGSPAWYVFGFAYIGITVEGKRKYVLMALAVASAAVAYYIAYTYPELVAHHSEKAAYFDSFSSIILVSILIVAMVLFENKIYIHENSLIEKQRKEIEDLSEVRNKFFSNMSHEIRTPIDSIIGFNELTLREDISEEVLENSQNIRSASKLLLSLINDVLDLSKLEAGMMEIVPVDYDSVGLLSETINLVWENATRKGLAFYVEVDPDIPTRLLGDDTRIEQILINILENAIKYTNEGSVSLSVTCNRVADRQAEMIYTVEDTGIGIKRDNLPFIFDEYKRIDMANSKEIIGTGLGLTIAKQLVDQMNGEILVNSVYTKGSTFVVKIPQEIMVEKPVGNLSLDEIRKREEKQFYRQSFEAPSARLLIVDDNQMNRVVTAKLLRDTKMIIDTESSGPLCLERCANTHYDAIFLDQEMPEMDGIECLRLIRSQIGGMCRETPVVVMTAHSSAEDQAKFRMAGFDGYLLKPLNGEMLENTLLRILPAELVHRTSPTYIDPSEQRRGRKDKVPILITSESVCDLPKEVLDKIRIPLIHYYIKNKNGVFLDGIEAETDGVLEYMEEGDGMDLRVETPTPDDYEDFFAMHLSDATNIIHIAMSSKAGDAYKNAVIGASAFDNVTVIDSEHVSSGIGLLVMEAEQIAESGKDLESCIKAINKAKKKIHTSFLINDTNYLVRLGRVSPKFRGISRIFMIRPSIIFKEGVGRLDKILYGPTDGTRVRYIQMQLDKGQNIDKSVLFITHSSLSPYELDDVRRYVGNNMLFDKIYIQKESAAMAAIHGKGAFGLLYKIKEE
ncbi:MAG: DegV family EDD domain-containing protein [Butyrivibrio sp.]|nr:DegV family EDD domain-containing protein [Butyrivibrio sp.]